MLRTAVSEVEESPRALIPDNDPGGLSRTLDISHPYRGEVLVTLTHPGGGTATVYDQPGAQRADIGGTWDVGAFDGFPVTGTHTLRVVDGAPGDEGTLKRWQPASTHVGWVATAWTEGQILDRPLGAPPTPLVLDLNGDGSVDGADLVHLLNHRRASVTSP